MKHLSEITLIAAVSFIGEFLHWLIPLPIPGSIYGLVLMLVLLMTKIVKIDQVKTVGDWLITLMPIMFVGPTVGLISSFDSYKDFIIPIIVIVVVTTIITMAVTGLTSQELIKLEEKKGGKHNVK
ncbi:MAG: CidA/LrgA family protein [Clostridiales bacterium]|nr:CidA/LrgA family protein [Clostridiales bacterium]